MKERKWFGKRDYLDNMKPAGKVLYRLGIIRYAKNRQSFSGGRYYGRFRYVYCNPLTWVFMLIILVMCLIVDMFFAIIKSLKSVIEFANEGIGVELDEYKSKECTQSLE